MANGLTAAQEQFAREVGKHAFWSDKVAWLVKILDMDDAALLVFAYHNFPDEVGNDLKVIHDAVSRGQLDLVQELLPWYRSKNLANVVLEARAKHGNTNQDTGLLPKAELLIFKRNAASRKHVLTNS